jgi:mRNA interferase RelE/StbE
MKWNIEYTPNAQKQLRKLDAARRGIILSWIDKNIYGCENPRLHGKALVGNLSGIWRYRIGDYRVLCEIRDFEVIVLAFNIQHRNTEIRFTNRIC